MPVQPMIMEDFKQNKLSISTITLFGPYDKSMKKTNLYNRILKFQYRNPGPLLLHDIKNTWKCDMVADSAVRCRNPANMS